VDFVGVKLEAPPEGEVAGRGALGADLAGGAACGRKLCVPERAGLLEAELGEPLAGRLAAAGAELDAELELGAEGGVAPGVLRPEAPAAPARAAAAASAGLEAPRTGGGALLDGGGVATVGPDADGAGRTLLDAGAGRLVLGVELAGAAAGRPLLAPDEAEPDDAGAAEAGAAAGVAAAGAADVGAGRPLDGAGAGRAGAVAGRAGADAGAGRAAAGGVAGVAAGGALVTDCRAAVVVEVSGRAPAGRTRVVSSAAPSFDAADVTCGDASVLIGTVPPPEFCRDVFSDRWLFSELTPSPPCSSSRRGTAMWFRA
jgi:hypothetical protein